MLYQLLWAFVLQNSALGSVIFHLYDRILIAKFQVLYLDLPILNQDIPGLKDVIYELKKSNIEVSLFIDPTKEEIKKSVKLEADAVELHTGNYANAETDEQIDIELKKIEDSAKLAHSVQLRVVAGHGINYHNITKLVKIGIIEEYNIGHSIISRAVFSGLPEAVKTMRELIK